LLKSTFSLPLLCIILVVVVILLLNLFFRRDVIMHQNQTIKELVDGLILHMAELGYTQNTRERYLAYYRVFIKYTNKQGICEFTLELGKRFLWEHQPDPKTSVGRRDLAIITLLYDSGARVQELIDLKLGNVRIQKPATVTLTGKGNKSRVVPIVPETAQILSNYLSDNVSNETDRVLFTSRNGSKFSRSGMEFIISKYVDAANSVMPALHGKKVTPHVFRHSKAMHLVQAGVNIIYIRDILGHISVQTTEVYAKADSDAKRKALEGASKNILPKSKYTAPQKRELLDWLKQLV